MSTRKYSWLALGLASIVVSGCAVGNKPHFNLGIADAFQKSKSCLWKKKLGYNAPAISSKFGYANPVNSAPLHSAAVAMPSTFHAPTLNEVTVLPAQPTVITSPIGTSNGGCSSCCNSCASDTEFYMPTETVSLPTSAEAVNPVPVTSLPFEGSTDSLQLENPLPAAIEAPSNPITPPSDEEEGLIETLDSASIDLEEVDETLEVTPEKDESSILETAAKALKAKTPTSAGESVVDERSKMVILTARPVQSHQRSQIATVQRKQVKTQQVTHKRHFREQNALRPIHAKRTDVYEHTAEAPAPIQFKPLPVLSKEAPAGNSSENNTGAPALKTKSSSDNTIKAASTKMQKLTEPVKVLEAKPEQEQGSVIKIARLPILKAESTSSAAIGSLRNFTNVRDLDPGFDKDYDARKQALISKLEETEADVSAAIVDQESDQ